MENQILDFKKICEYTGKLFLGFSHELEKERLRSAQLYNEVNRLQTLLQGVAPANGSGSDNE